MIETAECADLSIKHHKLGPPVPRRGGTRVSQKNRPKQPEWHDVDCSTAYKNMKETAKFLQRDPNNPYLRGKLFTEKKLYKKLEKQQQGKFLKKMFDQLDDCQNNDPKKYMEIVKKIRDGSFDKPPKNDSDSVPPVEWRDHFSNLLGPKIVKTEQHLNQEEYIKNNIEHHNDIFEEPLTKKEILEAIKSLKNNKSTSFDMVSNEMLKASMPALLDPIFELFSTMIKNSLYSNYWKSDTLSPVH